jgi:hypothetical protein
MKVFLAIAILSTSAAAALGQPNMQQIYRDAVEIQQNNRIITELENLNSSAADSSTSSQMSVALTQNSLAIIQNLKNENANLRALLQIYREAMLDVGEKVPGAEERIDKFLRIHLVE